MLAASAHIDLLAYVLLMAPKIQGPFDGPVSKDSVTPLPPRLSRHTVFQEVVQRGKRRGTAVRCNHGGLGRPSGHRSCPMIVEFAQLEESGDAGAGSRAAV